MLQKNIQILTGTNKSRRKFLRGALKLAALSSVLLPLQKAFGKSSGFIINSTQQLGKIINKAVFGDKLILNVKTKVVHLPTQKIFTYYADIAETHQKIIDLRNWETQIKAPIHFNKEKSGIILELLALQKLVFEINDSTLSAAIKTLAIAFSPAYKTVNGDIINKYNFRLHDLLLFIIALNNSIPAAEKWNKFQLATGNIYYTGNDDLPSRIKWIMTKYDFDKQVTYILNNKTKYTTRLKNRAVIFKL